MKPNKTEYASGGNLGVSKEDYFLVVQNWVYFTFNYPMGFVKSAFNSEHLESKFSNSYDKYGSNGVLPVFWANLDGDNRRILSLWVKNNYFNGMDKKEKLKSISDDDYVKIISHWNMFCFNFPMGFVRQVFVSNPNHFEQKWSRANDKTSSAGAVNIFFTELDGGNQELLTNWVYDNYAGMGMKYAGGGQITDADLNYYVYPTKQVKIAYLGKIQMNYFFSVKDALKEIEYLTMAYPKNEIEKYAIITPDKTFHLGEKEYSIRFENGGKTGETLTKKPTRRKRPKTRQPKMVRSYFEEIPMENYKKGGRLLGASKKSKIVITENKEEGKIEATQTLVKKNNKGENITYELLVGKHTNPNDKPTRYADGWFEIYATDENDEEYFYVEGGLWIRGGRVVDYDGVYELSEKLKPLMSALKLNSADIFAKGGMIEHGLRYGDKIRNDYSVLHPNDKRFKGIIDVTDKDGEIQIVNLDKGERYADGGRITTNDGIIEAFLTSNKDRKLNNLESVEIDDIMYLRNYQTFVAKRMGDNVKISSQKYSQTTSRITNQVKSLAQKMGYSVEYVTEKEIYNFDEFADGGRVTSRSGIIEAFLTSNRQLKVGNLSTHFNEYENQMLLRNYGTLIATRKGNNVEITNVKYSQTTSRITNEVNSTANQKGMNVSYVSKFADGGEAEYEENIEEIVYNLEPEAVKFEGNSREGFSVLVKDKNSDFSAFVDIYIQGSDVASDWNQYMFAKNNSKDMLQSDLQDNVDVFDYFTSEAINYLEKQGAIQQDDNANWSYTDKYADGGEAREFKYLYVTEVPNGLKLELTDEGINGYYDEEIYDMYDLFDDIQGNSEMAYIDNAGDFGFGLTEAPIVTDGYYYDDNGNFTDEGISDSKVYVWNDYMLKDLFDTLIEQGSVVLSEVTSDDDSTYAKGGKAGEKSNKNTGSKKRPKTRQPKMVRSYFEEIPMEYYEQGGEISVFNLRKGDKIKTRKGDIETIERKIESGYFTKESEYSHPFESIEFIERPNRRMADGGEAGELKNVSGKAFYITDTSVENANKNFDSLADTFFSSKEDFENNSDAIEEYRFNVNVKNQWNIVPAIYEQMAEEGVGNDEGNIQILGFELRWSPRNEFESELPYDIEDEDEDYDDDDNDDDDYAGGGKVGMMHYYIGGLVDEDIPFEYKGEETEISYEVGFHEGGIDSETFKETPSGYYVRIMPYDSRDIRRFVYPEKHIEIAYLSELRAITMLLFEANKDTKENQKIAIKEGKKNLPKLLKYMTENFEEEDKFGENVRKVQDAMWGGDEDEEDTEEYAKGGEMEESYAKSLYSSTAWGKITAFLNKKYSEEETDIILSSKLMRYPDTQSYAGFVRFFNENTKYFNDLLEEVSEPIAKSRYSSTAWEKITALLNKNYSEKETNLILRSKLMRYPDTETYAGFKRFYEANPQYFNDLASGNEFAEGGEVEDWMYQALDSLIEETGNEGLEITMVSNGGTEFFAGNDMEEYRVFKSEHDAEITAEDEVREMLEDSPENFNQDWLMNYIEGADFFEQAITEMNEGYVDDIEDESDSKYANRLISELVENGLMDEDDAESDDAEALAQDLKSDYVALLTDDKMAEGGDGLDYFILNFGEKETMKMVIDNNLIDIYQASKDAVYEDGIAHFLTRNDEETLYLSDGYVAYRNN